MSFRFPRKTSKTSWTEVSNAMQYNLHSTGDLVSKKVGAINSDCPIVVKQPKAVKQPKVVELFVVVNGKPIYQAFTTVIEAQQYLKTVREDSYKLVVNGKLIALGSTKC